ncbi:MAG: aconitase/3-isopropylmalate dehydratase large subunit family protein [Candidatus Parabeggiatoa sp.]|nr:aconitase/3-isopropylmalate dehydratase large subunit family protein [Candidatus Parabeggiatoa sp.]
MTPQSMTHKILAQASGKSEVKSGEIIEARIDLCFAHDAATHMLRELFYQEFGDNAKVWEPSRIALFQDHMVPAKDVATRHFAKAVEQFAKEQSIEKTFLYGPDYGVCHTVICERGLALPGKVIIGNDSHSTTYGAFNAFGCGVGIVDILNAFYTGELWFQVPEIIEIRIDGHIRPNIMAKDVILHILGDLGLAGASGKTIEFTGSTIDNMDIEERMTLCNMTIEAGATNAIMALSDRVADYLNSITSEPFEPVSTDPKFEYVNRLHYRAEKFEPMVALPHSPDNVCSISEIKQKHIAVNQVYVGSCTGGKLIDIQIVAQELAGKQIAEDVTLMIIPATMRVYRELLRSGIIETLMDAGAVLESPGCKACDGVHSGILGDEEVCLSTTNRNFKGRMGNPKSSVYLASPYVAAKSVLAGFITD